MSQDAELLLDYLGNVLYDPAHAVLNLDQLSPEFRPLGEGILYFSECIMDVRRLAADLARGDLSTTLPSPKNELAAPLKNLHASLRHLTWQTKQVAKGDYQQRVDFMGEFAESFNSMTALLEEQHKVLLAELEDSNRAVLAERRQVKHLENYAYRDKLTGTHNRHYGMQLLDEWLAKKWLFCVCFIDLDNLKFVNDTFGHAEGDCYLIDVAGQLKVLAPSAEVCRLWGDEFMVLLQGLGLNAAEALLDAGRTSLVQASAPAYPRSISYGIVQVDEGNTGTASDLLGLADERMYQFKKKHKKERCDALHQPQS